MNSFHTSLIKQDKDDTESCLFEIVEESDHDPDEDYISSQSIVKNIKSMHSYDKDDNDSVSSFQLRYASHPNVYAGTMTREAFNRHLEGSAKRQARTEAESKTNIPSTSITKTEIETKLQTKPIFVHSINRMQQEKSNV